MQLNPNDFLSVSEFARLKSVSRKTVYNWIKAGTAPRHERFSNGYLFYKNAVTAWTPPKKGRPFND